MIQSMTGFESGDEAINGFEQKVKIIDACRGKIVFEWIGENKIDTLDEDEFDAIFDYIEHLEETNEILEHTLKQATDAVLERNEVLEEHKRLHSELNDILHQNTEKPKNPSLCDLTAYVQHDLKK